MGALSNSPHQIDRPAARAAASRGRQYGPGVSDPILQDAGHPCRRTASPTFRSVPRVREGQRIHSLRECVECEHVRGYNTRAPATS